MGSKCVYRRKSDIKLLIDLRDSSDRSVQHDGKPRLLERREDFLRLAEGVPKKHGRIALLERLNAEFHQSQKSFPDGRKLIARHAVRGFHDQGFRVARDGCFSGKALAQLEVAGIKQGALGIIVEQLSRSQNMTRRKQSCRPAIEHPGLAEGQRVECAGILVEAHLHEARSGGSAENAFMKSHMVAVRMRNKSQILPVARIKP